jgi:UDP-hydrolysing UDP-N-acetyl-D-glucosamine 2-epimerase
MGNGRKICVVTGTRAEYNLLSPLLRAIDRAPDFSLQIIAAAAHLSPDFGLTYKVIEEDGFRINAKVEMLLASDTGTAVAKSMGIGTIGFADAFAQLNPELLLVLGDRFEILSAVQAALVMKLPVAHLAGGDTTEGAFDEAIRHSITKMSHLHFVTHEEAAQRVRQLGEDPARVFVVGSPGIDELLATPIASREEVERNLGFSLRPRNLLITYHPVTAEPDNGSSGFRELLVALDRLGREWGLIFTRPNADPSGREFASALEFFVARHKNAILFKSLGPKWYWSAMAHCDAIVGNSSSGLYETPSLKKPTIDIGSRQDGRPRASSVFHTPADAQNIERAIRHAVEADCSGTMNPYGFGDAVPKIMQALRASHDYKSFLKKKFWRVGD